MRDYGKVHTTFWSSETTRSMSEDGRALGLYLLTCTHGTLAGIFRLPDGYVCEDMQWTPERVCKGFEELLAKGFATRCATTKWVWVIKHLEWNPPENPNQKKSAMKLAHQIPDECSWKSVFMRDCGEYFGLPVPSTFKPLANPSETLSKPVAVAVTVTEEPNPPVASDAADRESVEAIPGIPNCPQQKLLALYAELLPTLTQPRVWEGARADAMRARWRQCAVPSAVSKGYTTEDEGLRYWRKFFGYVASSQKLVNGIPRAEGSPWQPDLEWLMKAGNFAKVVEGKYHEVAA